MDRKVRRGFLKHILPLPAWLMEKDVEKGRKRISQELAFVTDEHRKVHHYIVGELPAFGAPMGPGHIAREVGLTVDRVSDILRELEESMTFLYRNGEGEVVWAYPVTVEETPHRLTFSTGEKIYAA